MRLRLRRRANQTGEAGRAQVRASCQIGCVCWLAGEDAPLWQHIRKWRRPRKRPGREPPAATIRVLLSPPPRRRPNPHAPASHALVPNFENYVEGLRQSRFDTGTDASSRNAEPFKGPYSSISSSNPCLPTILTNTHSPKYSSCHRSSRRLMRTRVCRSSSPIGATNLPRAES